MYNLPQRALTGNAVKLWKVSDKICIFTWPTMWPFYFWIHVIKFLSDPGLPGVRVSLTVPLTESFYQSLNLIRIWGMVWLTTDCADTFSLGPSYRWAEILCVCLCVCLSVITPTFPLKTLLNQFRCLTDPQIIVWWMSGGVWWCLEHVWWCLVVSDACLVVSGGVNVYRLIWPELIDIYGQISLPVHWCC